MKKVFLLFIFLMVLFSPLQQNLFAQASGKISGRVLDKESREEIPFASVFVEGTSLGSLADVNGSFVILNVPPGVFTVTASLIGYQKTSMKNIRVNVDFTTKLSIEMTTGAIDMPAVIVQGERNPLIRRDLTNPTIAINAENIAELPVDQISDVIRLQAGVITANDGTIHVRGGRSNEIAYSLNGISLNDPYGQSRAIGIATNAVQEVSVSTGTFSAQYGNALSGVVNYVTKEGTDNYSLSLRSYMGDYISSRKELFSNIDDIDPLNKSRIEATFGGAVPLIPDAKFYLSSVFENFKGSLYGQKLYVPTDSYLTPDNFKTGDTRKGTSTDAYFFNPYDNNSQGVPTLYGTSDYGKYVAMNPSRNFNMQGNLSYKLTPVIKVKYEGLLDIGKSKAYSLAYKYNPDGVGTSYSDAFLNAIDLTHTVSENIFYTLKFSYGINRVKYYLYENLEDTLYLPTLYLRSLSNTSFVAGGTDNFRSFRKTETFGVKGDVVAQLFKIHEMKAGFESRFHGVSYESYSVEIGKKNPDGSFGNLNNDDLLYDSTLQLIRRKPLSPSQFTNYSKHPLNLAAYIQDKIEFESSFIVNAGLRYEYFDPAASYNPEVSKNLRDSSFGYISAYNIPAKTKHSLSPRLSMSYPITDKAIIRLSYGHFYQIASLSSLYSNNLYYVANAGSTPTFGNPNVEPQKSVQYEIGLQQQLTEDLKFDLTGFYKDVSNYIYTQSVYTASGRAYNVLTNLAYSNSRGITLSLLKRRSAGSMLAYSLDYTFSIAEGNRTEPAEELFFSEQSGKQSETYLVPLSFDRSHVISGSLSFTQPEDWNLGIILRFETGTPYTPLLPPSLVNVLYEQNSDHQPLNFDVDLKFEKYFTYDDMHYTIFLQVENLFDLQNELSVYSSSGRALTNIEQVLQPYEFKDIRDRINRGDKGLFGINQIDGFYSKRPERVNRPREVRLGFSFLFN
jgi:outer membrane receptor protein involved in Fe transport